MKQEKVLLDGYDIPFPKDLIVYNEDIKGAELRRDLPEGHPYVNTNRIENLKDVPGFKSKTGRQTFTLTDSCWKLDRENNILYITMGKDIKAKIKFRGYRKIEGSIRTVSITHDKTHKWWVVFSCTDVPYKEDVPTTGKSVGIDFGIHNVLADSDGNIIEAPTYFKKTSLQIIKVQQRLDEYKNDKQSRQYIQLSKRLAKLNERIKNQREYYVRMIAKKYTDENDIICLEDLDLRKIAKRKTREEIEVPGWSRKRDKNTKKKLHNIAPGMLRNTIKNTAENKRRCTPMVPSYYTSQTCSKCGDIRKYGDRLILEDPVYICRKCGFELHRDVNAAKVIHQRGLNQLIPKENNFTELGV
jgi:putative transposase